MISYVEESLTIHQTTWKGSLETLCHGKGGLEILMSTRKDTPLTNNRKGARRTPYQHGKKACRPPTNMENKLEDPPPTWKGSLETPC
jgi:hypothetical protein